MIFNSNIKKEHKNTMKRRVLQKNKVSKAHFVLTNQTSKQQIFLTPILKRKAPNVLRLWQLRVSIEILLK